MLAFKAACRCFCWRCWDGADDVRPSSSHRRNDDRDDRERRGGRQEPEEQQSRGWGNLEFLIYFSMPLFALGCLVMWILVAMAKALFESEAEASLGGPTNATLPPTTTTLAPGSNATNTPPTESPSFRRSLIEAFVSRKRAVLRVFAIIFLILFLGTFTYAVLRFKWFRKISCLHVLVIKYCDKYDTYEEGDVNEDKGGDYVSPFEKQRLEKEKQKKLLQDQQGSSSSLAVPEIKTGNNSSSYNNKHQAEEELDL